MYIPLVAAALIDKDNKAKKRMNLNLIQVAEEAKALFDIYAKHHGQKEPPDIEKRDRNINISNKLRDAIRQTKENISIEENLLGQAADEIQFLRNRNELLEVKVNTFETCAMMVRAGNPTNGYGEVLGCRAQEDIVGYIRKILEEKKANRVTKNSIEEFLK